MLLCSAALESLQGAIMLIVIGLLILAVLMFGSSRVIGAFGMALGFICAVSAFAYASYLVGVLFGWTAEEGMLAVILFFVAIIAAFGLVNHFFTYTPGRGWHRKYR
jgi:hypothetical protein